jgi:hypothetical protein
MDPWRAPQRVRRRHLADENTDLILDAWAAVRSWSRTPGPSAAEPLAMPSHDGVWLHEHHGRAPVPPDSRQDDPKQSVARLKMRAAGRAFHRRQLLPQRQVLQDQFPMAAERQRQRPADHEKPLQHASIVRGPGAEINGDEFWRGSGSNA